MSPRRLAVTLAAVALLGTACGGDFLAGLEPSSSGPAASVLPEPSIAPFEGGDEDRVVEVVDRVLPAVVNVTTDAFRPGQTGGLEPSTGTGTGFVVRSDGVIVTNCHVVEGANQITVITPEAGGHEAREFEGARVIGHDCDRDLAVLKVDGEDLPTVPIGDSADLRLGEQVIAIGYPLRLVGGPSVTSGIVSALDRTITVRDPNYGDREYADVIQTDAAINPGNSGGPLVNLDGQVVGINSAGVTADAAENIGFAIAIDSAKLTIERALTDPEAPVAYLGVVTRDVTPELVLQLDLRVDAGALVLDVAPGEPAEDAGIEPGDVIVGFDGQEVAGSDELGRLIRDHSPGDVVDVSLVRSDGSGGTVSVELALNPGPILG